MVLVRVLSGFAETTGAVRNTEERRSVEPTRALEVLALLMQGKKSSRCLSEKDDSCSGGGCVGGAQHRRAVHKTKCDKCDVFFFSRTRKQKENARGEFKHKTLCF